MNCLVYLPHSYAGSGPAESCVQIVRHFRSAGLRTRLFVGREKKRIPQTLEVSRAIPRIFNPMPWRPLVDVAAHLVDEAFRRALVTTEPGIAYFWPTPSADLVEYAKAQGWLVVREMTNRTLQAAKISLDEAFARAGESRPHHIDQSRVDVELDLLRRFDFIFSSNDDVDQSLREAGVEEKRILKTSFGWAEDRFDGFAGANLDTGELVIGYIGTISIGKGVIDLLEAWKSWPGRGRLKLAGPVDWSMATAMSQAAAEARTEVLGYVDDIEGFYKSCDIVVIPTVDEGGPQVTYEAAAVGSTIVATPMARARFLKDGRNAMLVPIHDPAAIANCFTRLANDKDLRRKLGDQAREDVARFAYENVGRERANLLQKAAASVKASRAEDARE